VAISLDIFLAYYMYLLSYFEKGSPCGLGWLPQTQVFSVLRPPSAGTTVYFYFKIISGNKKQAGGYS
jgi:hypothetical protein